MRANATLLFTEAFPMHDPDQNNQNTDEAIQKQLDTVMVRTCFTLRILKQKREKKSKLTI